MKTKGKTRNQWFEHFRKVKKGEKPADYLPVVIPKTVDHEEIGTDGSVRKWTTETQKTLLIPTYTKAQTVEFKRLCFSVLRSMFHGYFVGNRQNYIWHVDGHWVTCHGYLDNDKIRAHILGKQKYGCRAGDLTSCIVADMDLHKGSKAVFIRQLEAVMRHFHGRRRVHYSISKGGVHVIIMFDKPMAIEKATEWLQKELEAIDTPLVGNDKPTFKQYMKWLHEPIYAPMEPVFNFICDHLVEEKQDAPAKKKVSAKKKPVPKKDGVLGSLGKQKNIYRNTLVDFWTGKTTPVDSLNTAIVLTARMLPYYTDDADRAIDHIEELIDELPDDSFSDRLSSGNRAEVSRIIRATVTKVYNGNGGQPDILTSNEKLTATKKAWDRIGFNLLDKSTWSRASSSLGRYFNFTPSHIKSLGYLAEILKTDLETCAEVTRQILRIVHTQRELSIKYFMKVLKSFGISTRHDGRVNEFINALCELGWMIRLKNYFVDRARTFIAGDEFYGQVSSSTTHTHAYEAKLSVPPFALERELEAILDWPTPVKVTKEQEKPPPEPVAEAVAG